MRQRELWTLEQIAFDARRTVLIGAVSRAAVPVGSIRLKKQKQFWPRHADASFAAARSALVDFQQTKAYERFCRFLRDELWLDQYIRQGHYRLEYISFQNGEPQYRIYCRDAVLYVADTELRRLLTVQREVAAYAMAAYGFTRGSTYLTKIAPTARKYPRDGSWQPAVSRTA